MTEISIAIVVAVSSNGVIGARGDMPWHLPSDLKRFKTLTIGKPVIMGRKTFLSIGRLLPGRPNIIVSRDTALSVDGARIARTLVEAIALARAEAVAVGAGEICVIGGGEIYTQAILLAERLYVTEVLASIEGDTRFPDIDPTIFERTGEEPLPRGENDSHAMVFSTWRRKHPDEGTILPHLP